MNKPNYNEIIKTARKAQGLTQQELADEAGLSLRTVQRIERGTEEISGFSLRQICNVLDIPLEEIIMQNVDKVSIDNNQTVSIRNLYLSSLTFIIFPLLGFIVPAAVGLSKTNRSPNYNKHLRFILIIQGIQFLMFFPVFFFITTSIKPINSPTMSNTSIYIIGGYYILNIWIITRKIAELYNNINIQEEE